jgi:oxygen-independent coproporphyrinogen-3 oxidase
LEDHSSANEYSDLIIKEIDLKCNGKKEKADTIFFGGGTPSLMQPELLSNIIQRLKKYFIFDSNTEFTLECNPGTVDLKYFEEYKKLGVNRISFGVQSFNQNELDFLERIHSPGDVSKAFEIARSTGFKNISLDLIFAIPGQTVESWSYTIEKAIELDPDHISTYSLIYEEGTPLHRQMINKKFETQTEDNDVEFYEYAVERYKKARLNQYEVSNYSKPNMECKHNLKYWSSEEYYAFGPSAHGFVDGIRYANVRSIGKYIRYLKKGILPIETEEKLTLNDRINERLYLELRAKGLKFKRFYDDFGFKLEDVAKNEIKKLIDNKYAFIQDDKLMLTSSGYFIGDDITLSLMDVIEDQFLYLIFGYIF